MAFAAMVYSAIKGRAIDGVTKFGESINKNVTLKDALEKRFSALPADVQQRILSVAEGADFVTRNTEWTWDDLYADFLKSITDKKPNV